MKKFLLVTLISSFIIACGGGDGGSASAGNEPQTLTQAQIEEKFNLPQEPDPKINNATILGVDSNNNDIRDDWERAIAFDNYKDIVKVNIYNDIASTSSAMTKAYESGNVSLYQGLLESQATAMDCGYYIYTSDAIDYYDTMTSFDKNTEARKDYIPQRDSGMISNSNLDFNSTSPEKLKSLCLKYK